MNVEETGLLILFPLKSGVYIPLPFSGFVTLSNLKYDGSWVMKDHVTSALFTEPFYIGTLSHHICFGLKPQPQSDGIRRWGPWEVNRSPLKMVI